jgi:hypothetical protein
MQRLHYMVHGDCVALLAWQNIVIRLVLIIGSEQRNIDYDYHIYHARPSSDCYYWGN